MTGRAYSFLLIVFVIFRKTNKQKGFCYKISKIESFSVLLVMPNVSCRLSKRCLTYVELCVLSLSFNQITLFHWENNSSLQELCCSPSCVYLSCCPSCYNVCFALQAFDWCSFFYGNSGQFCIQVLYFSRVTLVMRWIGIQHGLSWNYMYVMSSMLRNIIPPGWSLIEWKVCNGNRYFAHFQAHAAVDCAASSV